MGQHDDADDADDDCVDDSVYWYYWHKGEGCKEGVYKGQERKDYLKRRRMGKQGQMEGVEGNEVEGQLLLMGQMTSD